MTRSFAVSFAVVAVLLGVPLRSAAAADGIAFVQIVRDGVRGVDGLRGVQAVALSPDATGRYVYVAGALDDKIAIFTRDAQTGRLSFVARTQDGNDGVDGIDGVRALAFSPDGAFLYTASNRDDAVAVFRRDATTGLLTFVERKRDNVDGVDGLDGAEAVVVTPDGLHVYAVGHDDRAVAAFARAPGTGALTYLGLVQDGVGGVNGLRGARAMAVSADGKYVYVTGNDDDDVVLFQRDSTTGVLTYVDRWQDDDVPIDGLSGAAGVVISPDGSSVYVAGDDDDAIAVFQRDVTTGLLTFVEMQKDGAAGVDGLDGVESIAVSSDGSHVYAGGAEEKALAVFVRDPTTGKLTFRAVEKSGQADVDGLDGVGAAAVSADALYVYTGGTDDDAVSVFSTRCGDGVVDANEQCDDGNAAAGDGCSPGCRMVCTEAADCADPDTCTEDRCQQGECSLRRCALGGGLCQVDAARTALLEEPACAPIHRGLKRAIKRRLKLAARVLRRASLQRDPDLRGLVSDVGDLIDKVNRKATGLADRGRITPACRGAIEDATALLDDDVSDMLLHRGICAQ